MNKETKERVNNISCTASAMESAVDNISKWENLIQREVVIISTDSIYYKNFKEYVKEKSIHYDGKEETAPLYISGTKTNKLVELMVYIWKGFYEKQEKKLNELLK